MFLQGGFDAVIGNPLYLRIQTLQETSPVDVEFFKKRYNAASKGNYDIYVVFVEKSLSLRNEKGRLGFILQHKFFDAQYGEPFRNVIAEGKHPAKVVLIPYRLQKVVTRFSRLEVCLGNAALSQIRPEAGSFSSVKSQFCVLVTVRAIIHQKP